MQSYMSFDYIIIGAGIAGITAAEELANVLDKKVLLLDKRNHIGGNCYDFMSENGTLVHKYGPHIIHTDDLRVYQYLSSFTKWNSNSHKILFKIDNTLVPVPFNFLSIDKILPEHSEEIKVALVDNYKINTNISIKELKESDNTYIKELGETIHNYFSKYYKKVLGISDNEINEFIDEMLPFRTSYDCRYFQEMYQVIPRRGYTYMFNKMLDNPNIKVILNTDYHEIIKIDYENKKIFYENQEFTGHLIFTGRIDEFFDYKFGELPYRSSIFVNENINQDKFQDIAVTYYPESYHFTRIIDYKYLCGEYNDSTTIQFEYPIAYNSKIEEESIPFYPINLEKNNKLYGKYKELLNEYDNVTFMGRLTEFKNLQIDEVVNQVLDIVNEKFLDKKDKT